MLALLSQFIRENMEDVFGPLAFAGVLFVNILSASPLPSLISLLYNLAPTAHFPAKRS